MSTNRQFKTASECGIPVGAHDVSDQLQMILNSGYSLHLDIDGNYGLTKPLELKFEGQIIKGNHFWRTRLVYRNGFHASSSKSVIRITSSYTTVQDLQIVYPPVKDVSDMAHFPAYPPAILSHNCQGIRLSRIQVSGGLDGIFLLGNCGDSEIVDCDLGCLDTNLKIDGHKGRTVVRGLRVWPHQHIHSIGTTKLWNRGEVLALDVGEADGIQIEGLMTFRAKVRFRASEYTPSKTPFGNCTKLQLDGTGAAVLFEGGRIDFNGVYSTTAEHQDDDDFAWRQTGGLSTITGYQLRGGNSSNAYVHIKGGYSSWCNGIAEVKTLTDSSVFKYSKGGKINVGTPFGIINDAMTPKILRNTPKDTVHING